MFRGVAQDVHDAVESADGLGGNQRDGIAESQRGIHERLGWFIAGPAPVLAGKRRLRCNQCAGILRVDVDKIGCFLPVLRHLLVGAFGQQPARPSRRGAGEHDQNHQRGGSHAAGGKLMRCDRHPECQGQAHQGIEFVQVAHKSAGAIEEIEVNT